MYHFKLTALLLLVIFISTITTVAAESNAGNANANTNANPNTNANVNVANANANRIVNANAANANGNAVGNGNVASNTNTTPSPNPTKTPPDTGLEVVFSGVDPNDKNNMVLKTREVGNPLQTYTFLVKDPEAKALVTKFKEGDIVSVTTDKDSKILKDISIVSQPTSALWHYFIPLLIFALFIFVSAILLRPRARDLIVGKDNRYSKSKLQIAVWFFLLITSYLALFVIRLYYSDWNLIGGISIPTNLLLLSGLSAFTFAAAKGITQGNVAAAPASKTTAVQPKFSDLFRDDENRIDLADFQMMVVTFLAVMTYVVQIFGFLGIVELYQSVSLPDVDTTILAAFGLGQGAYLVKKAVSEAPPTPNPPNPANPANPAPLPPQPPPPPPPPGDIVPPAGGN